MNEQPTQRQINRALRHAARVLDHREHQPLRQTAQALGLPAETRAQAKAALMRWFQPGPRG